MFRCIWYRRTRNEWLLEITKNDAKSSKWKRRKTRMKPNTDFINETNYANEKNSAQTCKLTHGHWPNPRVVSFFFFLNKEQSCQTNATWTLRHSNNKNIVQKNLIFPALQTCEQRFVGHHFHFKKIHINKSPYGFHTVKNECPILRVSPEIQFLKMSID